MTNTTEQLQAQQEAECLHNRIASFLDNYQVGSLLNRSGIRKLKGATALQIFTGIFMLAFEGVNFFRGIVLNASLDFKKDAAYDLLRNCHLPIICPG